MHGSLADRAVADLIVRLRVPEEVPSRERACSTTMATLAVHGVDAVELVPALQAADDVVPTRVVGVVPLLLSGQRHVDAVMEVVAPDGVEAQPSAVDGS